MGLFVPDMLCPHIWDIDLALLERMKIKALVVDVDNTLTHHNHPIPADGVLSWLVQMKQAGIAVTIVSNNRVERVAPFAQTLGLEFEAMSCKPLTFGLSRACKALRQKPEHVAIVGDQIFTDILGGNLKGMKTILVEPFEVEHGWFFRLKRKLEAPLIKRCKRKNKGG